LLIRESINALFVNQPREYGKLIESLPKTVTIVKEPKGSVDIIQVFVSSKKELQASSSN